MNNTINININSNNGIRIDVGINLNAGININIIANEKHILWLFDITFRIEKNIVIFANHMKNNINNNTNAKTPPTVYQTIEM